MKEWKDKWAKILRELVKGIAQRRMVCIMRGAHALMAQCWAFMDKLMGHSHLLTTMDIYTHLSEEYIQKDISKLNDLISNIKV